VTVDSPGDPLGPALGRAIRLARQKATISMRALAARCGVSQPFLSEIERGMAMPSIATLYRIADALELTPADLLPGPEPDGIHLIRASEGRMVASSEREHSAIGRLVFTDKVRGIEVYEYRATADDDLDVWFAHEGEKILYVIDGGLLVEFEHGIAKALAPGDCLVHPGHIAHRWAVDGSHVRLFLVIVRPRR
jgi:transcriptional regulator with XRE-family HTH domain